jgi:hypothetical protein
MTFVLPILGLIFLVAWTIALAALSGVTEYCRHGVPGWRDCGACQEEADAAAAAKAWREQRKEDKRRKKDFPRATWRRP